MDAPDRDHLISESPLKRARGYQLTPEMARPDVGLSLQKKIYTRLGATLTASHYHYLLLTLITLLAGILRFYKLDEWSFWGDELFTLGGREDGFNYTIARQSLSLWLIQTVVRIQGINEWNARVVPALIGLISIPILFLLVKRMFSPTTGLIAALLLAISPWHIYWSQNARFYTALLLFYTLALFVFYLGLEEDKPWYLFFALAFLGLAAKERLLALFFVPVVLSYLVLLKILPLERPVGFRTRNLLIFTLPVLILGLFFAGPKLSDLSGWFIGFGYVNNTPPWILAGVIYYVGLPTVCTGIAGAHYYLMQKNRASLLLSLGAIVPVLGVAAISLFHYSANRYAFISLTSWIVLASVVVEALFLQIKKEARMLPVGILLLLILQPLGENVLYYRYQNGNRYNWKAAFEVIQEQRMDGDLVVSADTELGKHYLDGEILGWRNLDLSRIEEGRQRVWFVEDIFAYQVFPQVHKWLERNAQLVAVQDVHVQARNFRMRVYLYDP